MQICHKITSSMTLNGRPKCLLGLAGKNDITLMGTFIGYNEFFGFEEIPTKQFDENFDGERF